MKINIMKLIKSNIPFTMVANEVLRSKILSWKAKGLYAYLFSKPDEWDFSSNRIIIESADGRSAIMSALRELENCGYLIRKKQPDGKMEYLLKHSTQSQETELRVSEPKSENRTVRKLHSAKTDPIYNKDVYSNTDSTSNTFDQFWSLYPKRVQKKNAERSWNKIPPDTQATILADLPKRIQSESWKKDGGAYIPHPTTYLNGERWNDEIVMSEVSPYQQRKTIKV